MAQDTQLSTLSTPADERDDTPPEDYHIIAAAALGDAGTRVLKHDDVFAVFDGRGDLPPGSRGQVYGIYLGDMRHLDAFTLRIEGLQPLLLGSTVRQDNAVLTADLTNPEASVNGRVLKDNQLHVMRDTFILDGQVHASMEFRLFEEEAVEVEASLFFGADFTDIFEIRGMARERRGEVRARRDGDDAVLFEYEGLEGVYRRTRLVFDPPPVDLSERRARFRLRLSSGEPARIRVRVECHAKVLGEDDTEGAQMPEAASGEANGEASEANADYNGALQTLRRQQATRREQACRISTSNNLFDAWIERSRADLVMLTTETKYGPYPYAGTPWFSTVFGRDGIFTALQYLWVDPDLASGVLRFLAAHQAEDFEPEADAEPGKILHELRQGEMAITGEVPFRRYYGSIDSTPLFVYLAGEHLARTHDVELARDLWPNVVRALEWIDEHGDRDGDGYIEYGRRAHKGLVQQGWKDSDDSVFHADGSDAIAPIALCEVQAYVYGARLAAAAMADALGHEDFARRQRERAEELQTRFERDFWCDDLGTYALALDGENRPCRVRTSNAGQVLMTGIASPEHARRVTEHLMSPQMYSGWGVRTLGRGEARYNPMSYHNGSIWPHDNAVVALGFSRYGHNDEAARMLADLFVASTYFDLNRLPELYCGFRSRRGQGPTRYPVACAPQAWAAGSLFMMLQASLGLEIRASEHTLVLHDPALPECIPQLKLENLQVGEGRIDLIVRRHAHDVGVEVLRREGEVHLNLHS